MKQRRIILSYSPYAACGPDDIRLPRTSIRFPERDDPWLRLRNYISDHWKCVGDVLYFESKEHGLIESCTFPHFQLGVPISVKVSPEKHRFLPKAEFPMDEFASKLARILFGHHPPQPLVDTLIGAAAYRFWDSWPSPVSKYDFKRRWNSPFWLPFYWYGATDEKHQLQLLNHLEI